jgi:hypothetical protein
MVGLTAMLTQLLMIERSFTQLAQMPTPDLVLYGESVDPAKVQIEVLKTLEALVSDGWVVARTVPGAEPLPPVNLDFSSMVHTNRDSILARESGSPT